MKCWVVRINEDEYQKMNAMGIITTYEGKRKAVRNFSVGDVILIYCFKASANSETRINQFVGYARITGSMVKMFTDTNRSRYAFRATHFSGKRVDPAAIRQFFEPNSRARYPRKTTKAHFEISAADFEVVKSAMRS